LIVALAAGPARAQSSAAPPDPIDTAARLYFGGKAVTARQHLVAFLDGPQSRQPLTRLRGLQTLMDICMASHADDCVSRYGPEYAEAARPAPDVDPALRAELVQSAGYYFDAGRLALGRPDVTAAILDWAPWKNENPLNAELYLQRQILGAKVALAQGKPALALGFLDNALALAATLQPGGADRYVVAQQLAQAIGLLAEIGQTERAYGLLRTAGGFVGDNLPDRSVDAAQFLVTAGSLLASVGDLEGAERLLAIATTTLESIELDPGTRDWLLGATLRLRAAMAATSDVAAARRSIDAHPLARLYGQPGRTPDGGDETAYLAVRALVAAVERKPDPVALAALSAPGAAADDNAAVLRGFGRLMLMPAGPERNTVLAHFGGAVRAQAVQSVGHTPGAWYRPAPLDTILLAMALSGARADGKDGGDLAFALFQLSGRFGPTFDSDALTALGAARTAEERATIHQALRFRAQRDRVERTALRSALEHLHEPAPARTPGHDVRRRQAFVDLAGQVAAVEGDALKTGAPLSGANLVPLEAFQSVLARDEAALGVAVTVGGLEYICVRRDQVTRSREFTDLSRLLLDARLVRAGLTATHAPSEASDTQYPVEAAMRLYDDLIRPFEACLKPGDRILWLPAVSAFSLPLAALLPQAPPRLERGWDLGQADWLVRRHATSYPGSASAVVAARSRRFAPPRSADFLGVGDPVLSEADAGGLPPLPDTKTELEASAKGFARTRLLLQGDATEGRVRTELATPYRYISFATHGLIRDDLQGLTEPALLLTPPAAKSQADDGLLTASEVADMALAARFVALSACNTANFDLTRMARELPALASAFAVAGVPATLGTLWPVNSETGRIVVSGIFERLRTQASADPADALADAQRAFLAAPPSRPFLHPRFWAPFVILGDGGGVER
jgi:CHAT domain-containing protein